MDKARNDLSAAVPKFCLALEEHRRTPEGRVRTSQEMLTSYFPHDEKGVTDRIFKYLPNEVRGPIIAAWGIRGIKAALRDNDEKIQSVVHDAVVAGDIDHGAFEDGLTPETLVRWVPLADLWSFWRAGKMTKQALHKALSTAYELYLFDARWFLDTISARGGSIKGTDVLSDGLTKEELAQWIHRIHETGDGTPKGIVAALGWDKIVAKTSNDVLVAVLDAMVTKVGLVVLPAKESQPRLPDSAPRIDGRAEGKPEAAANGNSVTAAPGASETAKPNAEENSWSVPPTPPVAVPSGSEEGIHVVVDDELIVGEAERAAAAAAASGPAARPRASAPAMAHEEENTPKPTAPRLRFDSPFKPKR
ncbi:MAG: hypothetical protein JOZ69_04900 [Myxococcales bacterium]|nr:hypothetical protein [Myxococcales bacterium]